ncbi:MAG: hypothetical protein ABI699_15185, partial [Caldimonas sp.]
MSKAADLPRATRPAPVADESWFGAFGPTSDTAAMVDDSHFAASWHADGQAAGRPSRPSRASREVASTTFERIYRAFIAARAALGVALVATLVVGGVFGLRPTLAIITLSVAFATLAVSMWLLPRFRRGGAPHALARLRSPQWIATIGADLVFFTGLHIA